MIAERTGKLEGIKRSDYLPFGEQIQAGVGGRATMQGYISESVRQGFGGYEEDSETGLDYAQARYYASTMGRFISTDNILISEVRVNNPQIWNSYSYVGNNPLNFADPSGMERIQLGRSEADIQQDIKNKKAEKKALEAQQKALKQQKETLSKADYEKQGADLKAQITRTGQAINSLNTELDGTIMVNAMLKELKDRGIDNGLRLSDFSVSTDPKADFPNEIFPVSIGQIDAFVVQKSDGTGPAYGGQIFINAKGALWEGAKNGREEGIKEDWILYGASVLRHEQWHRDAPTNAQRRSERLAYQYQLPILQSFQHDFSNASFYNRKIKTVTQRGW
jgi:RHS repeat-associated protein